MVMRHGYRPESQQTTPTPSPAGQGISGDLLGCYYCNDVVAPTDVSKLLCMSAVPYSGQFLKKFCIRTENTNVIRVSIVKCLVKSCWLLNFTVDTT